MDTLKNLLILSCLIFSVGCSSDLQLLRFGGEYDQKTREEYFFYKQAREQFIELKNNYSFYIKTTNLIKEETKIQTIGFYNFSFLRHLFLTKTSGILNNYYTLNFETKVFHHSNSNTKYNLNQITQEIFLNSDNYKQISKALRKTYNSFALVFDYGIEFSPEASFNNESLDTMTGILFSENSDIVFLRNNYKRIVQIEKSWYYFWRDLKNK